ncbi:filamentous hemagglutinin [Orbus hercynius]|uniref:Filamentous hemagglutinin n=1 Tax=Orbus hercynius TaxID=593135 RepID=A0A495RJR7_9GAMM|nr:hemagglutinin repeat-containing protein [Orbus hercynius]RKS87571.1 filamentous hemagglutinin [Orbus hercynius]
MNKHFYRIVFNKARGMLMVVADIVKSHQGSGRTTQKAQAIKPDSSKASKIALNGITLGTYLAFGWVSLVQPAQANTIVVDQNADKSQRPIVTTTANGVTQINIQTPTKGGVSHNKYTQFDVTEKGVILNNSAQMSQTELAGYVKGNDLLTSTGGAKLILNEINAKNASQLNGYIEVAGQKAQVVIANAAGITCNGCGFINADRATLTTGKPIMENGQLKGYLVEQGQIAINGKGLDSSRQSYTDLIARTVSINTSLWGNDVSVVAGKNRVSGDLKQIDKLSGDDNDKPQLAIDVAALGGMYAGKIQMIGTESGVGVHNAGNLGASAGGITITADGKIVNSGAIQAKQDIQLSSQQDIDNQKQIYSKQNVQLVSHKSIQNTGTIVAQNNIGLQATESINHSKSSLVAAGVDESGKLTQQGKITAQGQDIALLGKTLATSNVAITADQSIDLNQSTLVGGKVDISAIDVSIESTVINSSDSLNLDAEKTINSSNSAIASQGDIRVNATDILNDDSTWNAQKNVSLSAETINNQNTNMVAFGSMTQTAQAELNNQGSKLSAKGDINQTASTINNQGSELLSEQAIHLNAKQIDNERATIKAQGMVIEHATDTLNNQSSNLVSAQGVTLTANELIMNQSHITSNGLTHITAKQIDNENAVLLGDDITIEADSLSGGGSLSASNNIELSLKNDFNNQGEISANNGLVITTEKSITNNNKLVAGKSATINSSELVNQQGAEISADNLILNHNNIENQGLIDGENVKITSQQLNNNHSGRIYGTDLVITAQTLNNIGNETQAPVIAARNNFNLAVGTLNNETHSVLMSLGNFTIGGQLDESGKVVGSAQTINNHSSTIEAQGDLIITAHVLNNINDNIKTEEVLVDNKDVNEWSFITAPDIRFDNKDITEYCVGCGGSTNYRELKVLATGQKGSKYNHYIYTQKTYETQVVETDPSKIISGGNLTLITDKILNDNSHINAGRQLTLQGELENKTVDSIQRIVNSGTRAYRYDYYSKKGRHYSRIETYAYNPLDEITAIDLGLSSIKDNTSIESSSVDLSGRSDIDNATIGKQTVNVDTVSTVLPNTSLPNNSLYTVNKDTDKNYLIETDPRFTNKKNWLSSDYMFEQLKADPNNLQKRLGDGYYEQQLIKDQVTALTGQRYLGNYSSDLEQYQALMNQGVEFANRYGLTIGVELSDAQMKALTTDIVWMVSKTVNIDGQDVEVLVPQVYVVNRPEVSSAGALVSGKNAILTSQGDIKSSGAIVAKDQLVISANNIQNQGAIQGGSVAITAVDSILSNGSISADSALTLSAGNDVNLISTTRTQERQTSQGHDIQTVIDKTSTVNVKQGDMVIQAGNDINTAGALLINQAKDGNITLNAGNNLNLSSVTTRDKIEYIASDTNYVKSDATHVVGSEIYSQGNVNLNAGNDINVNASTVSADNALNLAANNININAQSSNRDVDAHLVVVSKGTFSKTKSTYDLDMDNTLQNGSALNGKTVDLNAKKDITVTGSQIVGTNDVSMAAGNDITVKAAQESYYQKENTTTKTSGLMSSGGLGFSIGSEKESTTTTDTQQGYVGSTVGSTEGNVSIQSGKDLSVKGSDIIAKQDINLKGDNVTIAADDSKVTYKEEYKYEKTGLTIAITGTAADVYDAKKAIDNAKHKDNDSLLALQSIKSGLTLANAGLDLYAKDKDLSSSEASIGVSATFGTQKTERVENQEQHNVVGSGVSAGQNVTITATGNEQKTAGDITVIGSEVRAGNDITLDANRDINVIGAVNTQHSDKDEKRYGGGIGIGIAAGGSNSGFSVTGNANYSQERENANGSAWSEGIVDAGKTLTVSSGKDTNVVGGQLKGDTVKAVVGNDLTIQSLQDTDNYDYDKLSGSVSGSYGTSGGGLNVSLDQTKMESNWASVTDQSGIYAGKGGFDVTVGNNTDLKGAVIASSAEDKSQNTLDTGTMSFSDIENKADFDVSHVSVNIGLNSGSGLMPTPGAPSIYHNDDSASSTTKSAVEDGTLIVRDSDKQQQNVDELSRDTANANDPLAQIFDKQKEQDRMDALDLVKDIAAQAKNVAQKYSQIAAEQQYNDLSEKEKADKRAAAIESLDRLGLAPTEEAIANQIINQLVNDGGVGNMGDAFSKGVDAASSIISGLITGDITGGLAGASAPYLAEQIKKQTTDPVTGQVNTAANLTAHAILGAAVAAAQGNSALAGGTGALTGEAMADIIRKNLYGENSKVEDLTQAQKEYISALAQLASGLAVAAGGGDTGDVGTAVAGSKNAVENNELQQLSGFNRDDNFVEIFDKKHEERIAKIAADTCTSGMSAEACTGKVNEVIRKEFDKGISQLIEFTTLAPVVGEADAIYIIWKGRSLSGEEVDRLWGMLGVFTLGYGQKVKMVDKLGTELVSASGKIVNKTDNILNPAETNNTKSPSNPDSQSSSGVTKPDVTDAGKGTTGTGSKAGEYLEDFKPSPTPAELVQQQAGNGGQVTINTEHILNGEIKTYANGTTVGTGGHYLKDPNIKVDTWTGAADANGVTKGYISVRDPATGKWVEKKAETTFFPENWSKRQTETEIKSAFENSKPNPDNKEMWQGTSSSGLKMEGYYKKPNGTGATAWPVYQGVKK